MADGSVPASDSAVTASPLPVADTAAVAPSSPASTVETAVASPAPASEVTAATPEVEKPADAPVDPAIISPEAEKPVEGEPAKPEEVVAPTEPLAPKYEFKIPEGVTADELTISAYSNVLGKYNISPEAGQELLEFHANTVKKVAQQMEQSQRDTFANMQRDWVKDAEKSFGNRFNTTVEDAKWAVNELIKDPKQRKEMWGVLAYTGAGNNKLVISAFANAAKRLRERSAPAHGLPSNGAKQGTAAERRYAPKS